MKQPFVAVQAAAVMLMLLFTFARSLSSLFVLEGNLQPRATTATRVRKEPLQA